MRLVSTLWVVVVLLGLGAEARADAAHDKARVSFRRGSKAYDVGDYARALPLFKDAYDEVEDPAILYNIGQCHRKLGHPREAIDVYRSFLRHAPASAGIRTEVQAMIAKLEKNLPPEAPPPPPVVDPAITALAPTAVLVAPAPAPVDRRPLYQRWQFWVPLSVGIVVVSLGVGLGVGLSQPHDAPYTPSTMQVKF